MQDNVTLIIKTLERPDVLARLIKSIPGGYHVIVADDSFKPVVRDDVEYMVMPYDSGISAGRNLLISKVKTKYFVLLDDDFIFTPSTDVALMESLIDGSVLDILGGIVIHHQVPLFYHGLFVNDGDVVSYAKGGVEHEDYTEVDFIPNFFIGRTDSFRDAKWDEKLKTTEHFDFFYSNQHLNIGYTDKVSIEHDHISNPCYKKLRSRKEEYLQYVLKKHGIRKLETYYDKIVLKQERATGE